MRVLVTGSRDWPYPEAVYRELNQLANATPDEAFTVVEGACPTGADSHAYTWTKLKYAVQVISERHPADWRTHGKGAGFIRNQKMVDLGADLCLAFVFNNSRGASDCVNRALSRGIPCRVIGLRIDSTSNQEEAK